MKSFLFQGAPLLLICFSAISLEERDRLSQEGQISLEGRRKLLQERQVSPISSAGKRKLSQEGLRPSNSVEGKRKLLQEGQPSSNSIEGRGKLSQDEQPSPISSAGKLKVLTSSTNLRSLTKYLAGDRIHLESILKGPQDPHFLSAKPSYMLKARKADLLIFVGMDLEAAWLPNIIQGARNPKIHKGRPGYLDAGQFIKALSVPEGKVNRFFGDIHPYGNPHYLLDPLRAVQVSKGISEKLSEMDPKNKDYYLQNQKLFEEKIKKKMKIWRKRIQDSGVERVVTYHSSFEYFLDVFQLKLSGLIEEKPGIAPSAKHILNLIKRMRESRTSCILVSDFYNNERAKKIQQAAPSHIESVSIEVGASKGATDYFLVMEGLIQALENCGFFEKERRKGA